MWTLVVFLCSTADLSMCYQTGPQQVFPTEESCKVWFAGQASQIDPNVAVVQYRCIGWGTPA